LKTEPTPTLDADLTSEKRERLAAAICALYFGDIDGAGWAIRSDCELVAVQAHIALRERGWLA
jgi:hypothetical protein